MVHRGNSTPQSNLVWFSLFNAAESAQVAAAQMSPKFLDQTVPVGTFVGVAVRSGRRVRTANLKVF